MHRNEADFQRSQGLVHELEQAALGRKEGRKSRIILGTFIAATSACLIPLVFALGWLTVFLIVQGADSFLFRALAKAGASSGPVKRGRFLAIATVGFSTIVFTSMGVFLWQMGGNSGKIFAVLLFCGSLVHSSVFLSQARFLYIASVAPFIAAMLGLPTWSYFVDHSMSLTEITPVVVASLIFLLASRKSYSWIQSMFREQENARSLAVWEKEKAQAANARLASINRALDEHAMVSISDSCGVLFEVNDKFCEQSGYTREELIGHNITMMDTGYHDKAFFAGMQNSIDAGKVWSGQVQNRDKDGRVFWSDVSISPITDCDEKNSRCICIRRDITQMHNAIAEAKAANAAKSEFLAMMSHELRTPMNAVLGMAQVLKSTKLDTRQREYLTAVTDGGEMLMTVLNDILDISKIEAGKMHIETIDVDVRHAVARLQRLWAPNAKDKGLNFVCTIADDVPSVIRGDITRIRQIVYNLLSNAVKFTEKGEVRLSVTAEPAGADETRLCFAVSDTGIGISQEAQSRLFSSFEQADKSTTRRFGGTGLGLAISKRLASLMNGDITISSKPGEGTCFSFALKSKIISRASLEKRDNSPTAPVPNPTKPGHRNRRILAAEDNPLNQRVLQAFLQPLQCELVIAEDGVAALEQLEAQRFDLVLMDVQMPRKDGLAATRELRASGGPNAAIPVIAMTANAMDGDKQKCLDAGMTDYVAKPIDPRLLISTIAKAFAENANKASRRAQGGENKLAASA